jgi:hypothetical protein
MKWAYESWRLTMTYHGHIENGAVVVEGALDLPDGTEVRIEPVNASSGTTLGQRLMKYAGTAKGLPSDLARNHDHYLHGMPKK